jgi:hypothetical protein
MRRAPLTRRVADDTVGALLDHPREDPMEDPALAATLARIADALDRIAPPADAPIALGEATPLAGPPPPPHDGGTKDGGEEKKGGLFGRKK